jgi:hypothetical protein
VIAQSSQDTLASKQRSRQLPALYSSTATKLGYVANPAPLAFPSPGLLQDSGSALTVASRVLIARESEQLGQLTIFLPYPARTRYEAHTPFAQPHAS